MAYQVKYRITYKRLSNSLTTIDILDSAGSAGITELVGTDTPLILSYSGDPDNIYYPTIGSGAAISFYATPLTMLDLFTTDPQKFMVKIYDTTLIWQGFVTSHIYSEDYTCSSSVATPITIQCNDGMQLLDKIKYKTAVDAYYLGTVNVGTVLSNILGKLGVTFNNIYTSSDLVIKKGVTPVTNLFLNLQIANENFVDEMGVAMSCRDVLNSILGGLGLIMKFRGYSIYIYDPINLHVVGKGKKYTVADYTESQENLGGFINISDGDISWFESNTILDVVAPVNQAIVKYDPYSFDKYEYDFNDKKNWSVEGTFSDVGTYWYNEGITFNLWGNPLPQYSVGLKEDEDNVAVGKPEYVLNLFDNGSVIDFSLPNFHSVTQDDNLQLRISFNVWVQTNSNDLNIFGGNASSHIINQVKIPVKVKIGNQYWKGDNVWSTTEVDVNEYQPLIVRQEGIAASDYFSSVINDTWTTGTMIVPLRESTTGNLISGNIEIEILDEIKTYANFTDQILMAINAGYVYHILLKDFKVECIDVSTGSVVNNEGVDTLAFISTNLTGKEDYIINTTSGTGVYGSSKAAFKSDQIIPSGTNITGLYRGNTGDPYNNSRLILQSFITQYKQPRFKLTGSLNVKDYLFNVDLKLIQDTDYLPSKSFYIISNSYNDRDESALVEMVEITSTRNTI